MYDTVLILFDWRINGSDDEEEIKAQYDRRISLPPKLQVDERWTCFLIDDHWFVLIERFYRDTVSQEHLIGLRWSRKKDKTVWLDEFLIIISITVVWNIGKYGRRKTAPSFEAGPSHQKPIFSGPANLKSASNSLLEPSQQPKIFKSYTPDTPPVCLNIFVSCTFTLGNYLENSFGSQFQSWSIRNDSGESKTIYLYVHSQRVCLIRSLFHSARQKRLTKRIVSNILSACWTSEWWQKGWSFKYNENIFFTGNFGFRCFY